jgi:archaellum biogenesis ATPase FlaH
MAARSRRRARESCVRRPPLIISRHAFLNHQLSGCELRVTQVSGRPSQKVSKMKDQLEITEAMRSVDKIVAAKSYIKTLGVKVLLTHGIDSNGNCTCEDRACSKPGKHPLTEFFPKGVKDATRNVLILRAALKKYPDANLAMTLYGLTAIDIDGPTGKQTVKDASLPATAKSRSGRGHRMIYQGEVSTGTAKGEQVDVLTGPDRYLIVPPSTHANGTTYQWFGPISCITPLTSAIEDFARGLRKAKIDLSTAISQAPVAIREGGRNTFLTRIAGLLRHGGGLGGDQLQEALSAVNAAACKPPLNENEVSTIAKSVGRYALTSEAAFVTLSDVKEEEIDWLYYPYLPRGSLTCMDGDPGQGKSTFCAALAAALSTGTRLPFSESVAQGDVVILAAEDSNASVQVPRIRRNGGDLTRIHAQATPFSLDPTGLALLRAELEKHHPALVIIDPITAYMSSSVDFHRVNDTTEFLVAVEALAREFNCAILIIRHLNKSSGNVAIYRGIGSIAVSARIRSGLILGRHPDDPNVRAIAHSKSNYAKEGPTILFELSEEEDRKPSKVIWLGTTNEIDATSILSRPPADKGRPDGERDNAKEFLRNALANGPIRKSKLDQMAQARSITEITLRRAADDLAVIKGKEGKHSVWALPERTNEENEDAA